MRKAIALGLRAQPAAAKPRGMTDEKWQFWIDRGGTFTDIVARGPDGSLTTHKLLSENPGRYRDAAIAGIKTLLRIPLDAPIPPGRIAAVKMGTTVATNALLERKGERTLLVVNRGFADALRIGNQTRPRLFDLAITLPTMLYESVLEITGRVGVDGEEVERLETAARHELAAARAQGIAACAIVLMHAWKYPEHEQRLAAIWRARSGSPRCRPATPSVRCCAWCRAATPRWWTRISRRSCVVTLPRSRRELAGVRLYFMQSNGGLAEAHGFQGKDAILSAGRRHRRCARTAAMAGLDRIIGFDMGGTSTDVALYDGGFERAFETAVAGVRLRAPMMAINTVAAGGGSILHFDGARFRVGPIFAGADPGPACYRRGGPLTVTDATVCVGNIQPAHFPAIFGPHGNASARCRYRARRNFAELATKSRSPPARQRIAATGGRGLLAGRHRQHGERDQAGLVQKGHDAARFALQCFGGAGGQHACAVADALGMETVFIHPFAGVLSAYGMGPCRPDGDARASGRAAAGAETMRESEDVADGLTLDAEAALAGPGRRRRSHQHVAFAAPSLRRHRGRPDRCIARSRPHRRRTSPRRIARALASPRRNGRWWWRRSRWKRSRRARR